MKQAKQLLGDLRKDGHKMTAIRRAIVEVLAERGTPATVQDLLALLGDRGLRPNKTTVYRELAFLKKKGSVDEVTLGDRAKRYELRVGDHHHHLVCTVCGRVADVHLDGDLDATEKKLSVRTGFVVLSHALEFFGLCSKCK
jgi:Fur family ferric uptake transcriptional regulator